MPARKDAVRVPVRRARSTPTVAPTPALSSERDDETGPVMRRWTEQRWQLDNTIRAVGLEWDQPRIGNYGTACGPQALGDLNAIRARVQKYADIAPAFEAAARRREAAGRAALDAGRKVTAREHFYTAAVFWAASQWPFHDNHAHNLENNARKRACYETYATLADHVVETVWINLPDGRRFPAWFHLPHGIAAGSKQKLPAIVSIPGMDGFKESNVALNGDRWLARGIAVLVLDGPGQYEAAIHGVHMSVPAWQAAGRAAFEWLSRRPEVDAKRIGLVGNSFGTFFATIAASAEPRFAAVALSSICLEPGGRAIFDEASPTFKRRFMYMAGIADEARFERFRKTLTWEGHAQRIRAPLLCIAGERDELCPLIWAERMMRTLRGPKQLVVYQDSRHTVGGVPSAVLGPAPAVLAADWMAERLSGSPAQSARWFVDGSGRVNVAGW